MDFGVAIFPTDETIRPRDLARAAEDRGILLIVQRDPITTAKALASLDVLSGGRLEVGVGAGWNLEEMRDHGTDPARRFGLMRERVEAMKEIWTSEEASYHGRHVDFERIWSWPKPAQRPHPPRDPAAFERFAQAGAQRCVFWLASTKPDEVLARLERCAGTVDEYRTAGG
jgi:alkanesulfonate monooxygenase SsuD/methylene tetrahydromethanopterin reductase-like flavin-dependent oxidoreductase (luciferase family)